MPVEVTNIIEVFMARLNVQGLARRDKKLLSCIRSEPNMTLVSVDLSAGEPTVTAHFSKDENYLYATQVGVGKAPFFKDNVLMIDDIYIMTMSVSPVGAQLVKETFAGTFEGRTFVEQWLEDSEVIKDHIKGSRKFHKIGALGFGYGMGPTKFKKQAYDNGYDISLPDCKVFYAKYWELYARIRKLANALATKVRNETYLVNPFGYRLKPEPHKAYNYFIQSSVSSIMHMLNEKFFTVAPFCEFVTVIHDEVLMNVPDDRLDEAQRLMDEAVDSLNSDLGWTVPIRVGWAPGKNWYEAK